MRTSIHVPMFLCVLCAGACGGQAEMDGDAASIESREEHDAFQVKVQHILVSFAGAPNSSATRTKEEAEKLAGELYDRAVGGEDFAALVAEYTNDSSPGIYTMTATAGGSGTAYPRDKMAPSFGDVAWRLEVGEIGMAPYDETKSPYGWHIIKRLE